MCNELVEEGCTVVVFLVLNAKGVDSQARMSINIKVLKPCHVLSQVFTTHYALKSHDLIKRSCLLCEQLQN